MKIENKSAFIAGLAGVARAGAVSIITHPCEVLKIRMQTLPQTLRQAAVVTHKTRGITGFYDGYLPRMIKILPQQAIAWSLMVKLPQHLKKHVQNPIARQLITACGVGAASAALTTPLDNAKILSVTREKKPRLFTLLFSKDGWRGISTNWFRITSGYGSFLCFQEYYKNKYREFAKKEDLSIVELSCLGLLVAATVNFTTITVDKAYTQKVAKNISFIQSFQGLTGKEIMMSLGRGGGPHFISLSVHNIASVILLDMFS